MLPIPPIPLVWRAFVKWEVIRSQVDAHAESLGQETYSQSPQPYQFSGWGFSFLKGVQCNVKRYAGDEVIVNDAF